MNLRKNVLKFVLLLSVMSSLPELSFYQSQIIVTFELNHFNVTCFTFDIVVCQDDVLKDKDF